MIVMICRWHSVRILTLQRTSIFFDSHMNNVAFFPARMCAMLTLHALPVCTCWNRWMQVLERAFPTFIQRLGDVPDSFHSLSNNLILSSAPTVHSKNFISATLHRHPDICRHPVLVLLFPRNKRLGSHKRFFPCRFLSVFKWLAWNNQWVELIFPW